MQNGRQITITGAGEWAHASMRNWTRKWYCDEAYGRILAGSPSESALVGDDHSLSKRLMVGMATPHKWGANSAVKLPDRLFTARQSLGHHLHCHAVASAQSAV